MRCELEDLTHPHVAQTVLQWFADGRLAGLIASAPTDTWALRAKRCSAGALGGPLRSKGTHIYGHPHAMERPVDELRIRKANEQMEALASLIEGAITRKLPCAVVAEVRSFLRHAPPFAALLRSRSKGQVLLQDKFHVWAWSARGLSKCVRKIEKRPRAKWLIVRRMLLRTR